MAGVVVNPVALLSTSSVYFLIIPLWIHSGRGQLQLSWLLFSTSTTLPHQAPQHSSTPSCPPTIPLLSPFFMWPLWPVLCDSTARGPHAQVAKAMTLEGPSQTHTYTHTLTLVHRHTRLHTAAKASDRYSIIRRVARGWGGRGREGARRVALQWAHCRDTGEIRERVRVWVCLSGRVTERESVSACVCVRERGTV